MKYKTTAKAIRAGNAKVIAISYAAAQALLNYRTPEAYACGVYGWNFDVYRVGCPSVVICTGYRGMPGIPAPYELVRELELKAQNATQEEREELLAQLIAAVIK